MSFDEMALKQKEILKYLVSTTRQRLDLRTSGYTNNGHRLLEMRFFGPSYTSLTLALFEPKYPAKDFDSLIKLTSTIAERLSDFKNTYFCYQYY